MFCTESCEHGCNATSSVKLISGNVAPSQTQQQGQQQFSMCYAPLSVQAQEPAGKCESEPPRVGMCLVTEGPEGLSIDCNVPLPNSFNLDEYRKQMVCSCGPSVNGSGYIDGYCLPPPATAGLNAIQTPACTFQCQCCPVEAASSSGFDTRSMQAPKTPALGACSLPSLPTRTQKAGTQKVPEPAVGPQIFYLAAPTSSVPETESSSYPPDQLPACLYSIIPMQCMSSVWSPQAISLVPVGLPIPQPQLLPQQQLVPNPTKNSQLPPQQIVRYDLPLPRLLAELRRERDRPCGESPTPVPLTFQLYAPAQALTFYDPLASANSPSLAKKDIPAATPSADPMSVGTASQLPSSPSIPQSPPAPDPARSTRARTDSPKCSRSCQRSKDSSGTGNLCMKCGNCWHCPRCSCSNCFWHPGLVRALPRDSR